MSTNLRTIAKDGSVIVGRSMDLNVDLHSTILVFPRGYKFQGQAPNNKTGLTWTGKYGFVGMSSLGLPSVSDGLNEKGLYCGCLYLPGFTQYQDVSGVEQNSISQVFDVANWVLSNFSSVEEVKKGFSQIKVWGTFVPQIGVVTPLHYIVHDVSGNCAVFEFVDGQLKIYDNPLGVLTNAPTFDWHMVNLRNYVNLSATQVPELNLKSGEIKALGEGTGMLGLPGDTTPPSRFVRAVAYTQAVAPAESAEKAIKLTWHIIDNFDLPFGFAREIKEGKIDSDYTQWMTVSDLKNKLYFVRYYDNPAILKINLSKLNFAGDKTQSLNTSNISWFTDIVD